MRGASPALGGTSKTTRGHACAGRVAQGIIRRLRGSRTLLIGEKRKEEKEASAYTTYHTKGKNSSKGGVKKYSNFRYQFHYWYRRSKSRGRKSSRGIYSL